MRSCKKCLLPETYETIEYNNEQVCNICVSIETKKKINWNDRVIQLNKIINKFKGHSDYDCIIPFSGGKDSTFQLYYAVEKLNLKPLVIRFNHGFYRPTTLENTQKTLKKLGVDFIDFTPNWKIVKELMLESFTRKTDFCWHCHTGIYSYPVRMAIKLNVPLIIWGEPNAEMSAYFSYEDLEEENEEKFNMFRNLGITSADMFEMLNDRGIKLEKRDLLPYAYPDKDELKKANITPIYLGNYINWNYQEQVKIIQDKLDWKGDELEGTPDEANKSFSKIECFMQGTRDYIKFLKRGYSRTSQNMADDLRKGIVDLDKAKELKKLEGKKPSSLELFLEYIGISEEDFNKTISTMVVHPNKPNFNTNNLAKKTHDFEKWYRDKNK